MYGVNHMQLIQEVSMMEERVLSEYSLRVLLIAYGQGHSYTHRYAAAITSEIMCNNTCFVIIISGVVGQ